MSRVISWFSCGAASAVASKLAIQAYGDAVQVVYCDTMATEHPDNQRFFEESQRWFGREILRVHSEKYRDIDDVFMSRKYMSGIAGAICTVEMKKVPRFAFQEPTDLHVFGYHAGEGHRAIQLAQNDPGLSLAFPLIEKGYTKQDCLVALLDAGIELPVMYRLGYTNNNCLGCVKATSYRYWQAIRHDFPEVFERRARQSRELGVRLVKWQGERIFLDELPAGFDGRRNSEDEDLSCGPECALPALQPSLLIERHSLD